MLANVALRCNTTGDNYQGVFPHLSALDLDDIRRRCPMLDIVLNPNDPHCTLTEQQRAEWTARLFWGDNEISMHCEDRRHRWVFSLLKRLAPSWHEEKHSLDVERAVEWAWLTEQVLMSPTDRHEQPTAELRNLANEICANAARFLESNGYREDLLRERLQAISGK